MGQALRRATGRAPKPTPSPKPSASAKSVERPPRVGPTDEAFQDHVGIPDPGNVSNVKDETNVLEERDPGYDAMLNKMVGRITSKPGGKLEMGEAFIVEKYNRPMPKLRSSKAENGANERKSEPPGTLNASQLQQVILLYQGKSEEHKGPMEVQEIAQKFRIDTAHVERIVQFLSLPPENDTKNNQP